MASTEDRDHAEDARGAKGLMMMARSNTAGYPDISAILEATASASTSGSTRSGRLGGVLFFVVDRDRNHRFFRIKLPPGSFDVDASWIDDAFAALETRLSSSPDQELLDAAEGLVAHVSAAGHPGISDEWIEAISDHWSKFQD